MLDKKVVVEGTMVQKATEKRYNKKDAMKVVRG
jgi:uncharacterized protein YdeI (BOF family)